MADINFFGDSDQNYLYQDPLDIADPEQDEISTYDKFLNDTKSSNISRRINAGRFVVGALKSAVVSGEAVEPVLQGLRQLVDDEEISVRVEALGRIALVSRVCVDEEAELGPTVVREHLLPLLLDNLLSANTSQVRKASLTALVELVEGNLLDHEALCETVIPAVLRCLEDADASGELRGELAQVLCKLAPLCNPEIADKIVLFRFNELCIDDLFQIRKICASCFADVCLAFDEETVDEKLIPSYKLLCSDGIWGVRKACAESFPEVAHRCSTRMRQTELAELFVKLLEDNSKWVRVAAYKSLGQYISSFEQRSKAESKAEQSEVTVNGKGNKDGLAESQAPGHTESHSPTSNNNKMTSGESNGRNSHAANCDDNAVDTAAAKCDLCPMDLSDDDDVFASMLSPASDKSFEETRSEAKLATNGEQSAQSPIIAVPDSKFGSFVFWRDEIPPVDNSEIDIVKKGERCAPVVADASSERSASLPFANGVCLQNASEFVWEKNVVIPFIDEVDVENLNPDEEHIEALFRGVHTKQTIVPSELLYHFMRMADASMVQHVDSDVKIHCAFSFPGVVLALGRDNWPILRTLFRTLAEDMQWKVRRTLASSLADLSTVIGPEYTARDLLPFFNECFKDLDEVKGGMIRNMARFLERLPEYVRVHFLPKFADLVNIENIRNWRFRDELARQLGELCPLYSAVHICQYIVPIAITLIQDRVGEVVKSALEAIAIALRYLAVDPVLHDRVFTELIDMLASHSNWKKRQIFVNLLVVLVKNEAVSSETMLQVIVPQMMRLAKDKVNNIRLGVAESMTGELAKHSDFLSNAESNPQAEQWMETLESLKNDPDLEVRRYATRAAAVQQH